jgi:xanthine/uracil permease
MGMQQVIAMFGRTVPAPLLMGFDPNVAILMSSLGTLIFFVVAASGPNTRIGVALGGIGTATFGAIGLNALLRPR